MDTDNETYFKDFDKVNLCFIPQNRAFFISCYAMINMQRNFTTCLSCNDTLFLNVQHTIGIMKHCLPFVSNYMYEYVKVIQ